MERDALALVSGSAGHDVRASQQSNASDSNIASSAQLHKQLLAAEVAKVPPRPPPSASARVPTLRTLRALSPALSPLDAVVACPLSDHCVSPSFHLARPLLLYSSARKLRL